MFKRAGQYHATHEQWQCSKAFVAGQARYTLWDMRAPYGARMIGTYDTAEDAWTACQTRPE